MSDRRPADAGSRVPARLRSCLALVTVLLASATFVAPATAGTGGFDATFGRLGRAGPGFDDIAGIAAMADGRIVVASTDGEDVARFTASGHLDFTFGARGRATLDLEPLRVNDIDTVALQPDGRILLVGSTTGPTSDVAVVRLTARGVLDPTFGGDGVVTTDIGVDDDPNAVAVQPDGRIVVAGNPGPEDQYFAVVRYLADGTLDATFGDGGIATTAYKGDSGATAIAFQPDGAIVAVGDVDFIHGSNDFGMLRYSDGGLLDPGFGNDGKVSTRIGGSATALAVVVLPSGRIVVAGWGEYPLAMAGYLPDGRLDSSFGTGGLVKSHLLTARFMLRRPDGGLVVAGALNRDLAVARLTSRGTADRSFAAAGVARLDYTTEDEARGIAIQPDGRVVVAGDRSLVRIADGVVLPETRASSGPPRRTRDATPTFAFSGSGSSFQCRIDMGAWSGCRSPRTVRFRTGRHTFRVRARDAAGNVDPTPVTRRVEIVGG